MTDLNLGLTKTYNLFHDPEVNSNSQKTASDFLAITEFKNANLKIPVEEAVKRVEHLRGLHKQMDEAVLKAYDWEDIDLKHDFYEVEYLPENDRIRYTISPKSRKEILRRLLALNHRLHTAELQSGLWEPKERERKNRIVTEHELTLKFKK